MHLRPYTKAFSKGKQWKNKTPLWFLRVITGKNAPAAIHKGVLERKIVKNHIYPWLLRVSAGKKALRPYTKGVLERKQRKTKQATQKTKLEDVFLYSLCTRYSGFKCVRGSCHIACDNASELSATLLPGQAFCLCLSIALCCYVGPSARVLHYSRQSFRRSCFYS